MVSRKARQTKNSSVIRAEKYAKKLYVNMGRISPWFTCNVDVLIYSEKVALISLRDLSAIVIENKDIVDLFRNMHAFMWKAL